MTALADYERLAFTLDPGHPSPGHSSSFKSLRIGGLDLVRGPGAPGNRDNPRAPLCSEAGPGLDQGPGAPYNRDDPQAPLCSEASP